jgi:hypothetical protein
MDLLTDPEAWLAFAALVALEVVLGIDNIVFISILADKVPAISPAAISSSSPGACFSSTRAPPKSTRW